VPGLASKIASMRASVARYSACVLMTFGFMTWRPRSYGLGIDFIVFLVGSHEADVNREEGIVDPHDKPVLVSADIEHDPAVLQNARGAVVGLQVSGRSPLGGLSFRMPSLQSRLHSSLFLPVFFERFLGDDAHFLVPSSY